MEVGDMRPLMAALTQSDRGTSRNALVQDQMHQDFELSSVGIRRAVLKVSGSEG
jgi:hypothetical protein